MATLTGPKVMKLADIKTTFFVRKSLDDDRVLLIAGLYQEGTKIPFPIVNSNGELIDGRHRNGSHAPAGMEGV